MVLHVEVLLEQQLHLRDRAGRAVRAGHVEVEFDVAIASRRACSSRVRTARISAALAATFTCSELLATLGSGRGRVSAVVVAGAGAAFNNLECFIDSLSQVCRLRGHLCVLRHSPLKALVE